MLRRTISGEGMQHRECTSRAEGAGAAVRAALAVALAGAGLGAAWSPALAQTYGSNKGSIFDSMMQTFGLGKSDPTAGIDYTERSPLVIPPTRDLPAPGSEAAVPGPDWPRNPPAKSARNNTGPTPVVPGTAVQTPNPPVQSKPWYNPAGWFDKEEYANFAGEPVRRNLTDPPAGYRVPSPEQPYGIGPDKKGSKQATAKDFNMGSASPPSGQPGQ